jgi:hypothetical protein
MPIVGAIVVSGVWVSRHRRPLLDGLPLVGDELVPNIQLARPPRGRWPFLFPVDVHPQSPTSVRGGRAPLVHAPVELSGRCSRLHRSRRSVIASFTIIITLLLLDVRVHYPAIRVGRR